MKGVEVQRPLRVGQLLFLLKDLLHHRCVHGAISLIQSVATTTAGRPEGFAKIRLNLMATREVYQFREFTLDVGERRLSRGEVPVHLPPKAHDLLVMLVQQPGRLLTKDELLARIWPDAFVEEGILSGACLGGAEGPWRRRPASDVHRDRLGVGISFHRTRLHRAG